MSRKRLKVPVTMQQNVPALDTPRSGQRIDCLSHRDSHLAQLSKVPGRRERDVRAADLNHWNRQQQFSGIHEITIAVESLKNFGKMQVANGNRFTKQQAVQSVSLACINAVKVVDPNARIHQNQRSVLIASKSPVHFNFPLNRRIFACWLSRNSVRRPSSTASRFVFSPVAFKVSFISSSSMTMLVRMMCIPHLKYTHPSRRVRSEPATAIVNT